MSKREIYLRALDQIPRLLSLLDRNVSSPTFGCFYRAFWHDKVTDVICAHPQISVLALALVYKYKFSHNPYFLNEKIKNWAIAGMNFWCKIQNKDGSFNEHYPCEHSFGATSWTLYAISEAYRLLREEIDSECSDKILHYIEKAAKWLTKNDEPRTLTNHQIIAAVALQISSEILKDKNFSRASRRKLQKILTNQSPEGWFIEYDGVDLGYLTTTISFLAKYYRETKTSEILDPLKKAVTFTSYFVYPDGSYGGCMGSRHTSHFHPHGFEILREKIPLAGSIANKILEGIKNGNAILPSYVEDKYLSNFIIEFLQSYLDFGKRRLKQKLPYERHSFRKYFPHAGFYVIKEPSYYATVCLKKGGIFKIFNTEKSKIIENDSGLVGLTKNGRVVSSQWLDSSYEIKVEDRKLKICGNFHEIPVEYITPTKMVFSRIALFTLGWSNKLSFFIKKYLIEKLITKSKKSPAMFERKMLFFPKRIRINDLVECNNLIRLSIEDEFAPRYVPASRYFRLQELLTKNLEIKDISKKLNETGKITIIRDIFPLQGKKILNFKSLQ